MKEQLENLKHVALAEVALATDAVAIENLRIKYLGRKGEVTAVLKQMGALPPEERPAAGALANELRSELESAFLTRGETVEASAFEERLKTETLDVTIPGNSGNGVGHKHPVSTVWDEAVDIFLAMGFTVAEGPEIELSEYCFDKLNTPPGHPARDRQDTFYLDEDEVVCLRTQTSSVQIRTMEKTKPPIRIISPGRVYRKDEIDATHSPIFLQLEGLVVDKGITMGNLKWTLNELMRGLYGPDVKTRFRPHHFPYTEPSCEVDMQCFACGGKGCRVCKGEGWIELLGAGMVHPKVLAGCGIDPDVYSGFAFGIGIERLTMLRFEINDLRLLYENDFRFLKQF
ncbi:MAG: phenylalanine--tRNA ligase subunit alpha [Oscillospiraceae bacterium]|jgi:phenylalanyl-tRNA synthetase alpha chain|nr:phenylalanine--tRNA ligase subunit alpha [Oscillospiraceae bacterium]